MNQEWETIEREWKNNGHRMKNNGPSIRNNETGMRNIEGGIITVTEDNPIWSVTSLSPEYGQWSVVTGQGKGWYGE